MKMQICAVFDTEAKAYSRPFFTPQLGIAIRAFGDEINIPENKPMSDHPDHFNLYHIGTFDDESGTLEPCLAHMIATGAQLSKKAKGNGHA